MAASHGLSKNDISTCWRHFNIFQHLSTSLNISQQVGAWSPSQRVLWRRCELCKPRPRTAKFSERPCSNSRILSQILLIYHDLTWFDHVDDSLRSSWWSYMRCWNHVAEIWMAVWLFGICWATCWNDMAEQCDMTWDMLDMTCWTLWTLWTCFLTWRQEGAVPKLGDRAAELVAEAQQGGPVLAKAVEAALEPLFLRQVRETRQILKGRYSRNTISNTNIYKYIPMII